MLQPIYKFSRKPPAYTHGCKAQDIKDQSLPGPGEHDPNFNYVKKNKPAYTFGYPYKRMQAPKTPPPNTYCEKKVLFFIGSNVNHKVNT